MTDDQFDKVIETLHEMTQALRLRVTVGPRFWVAFAGLTFGLIVTIVGGAMAFESLRTAFANHIGYREVHQTPDEKARARSEWAEEYLAPRLGRLGDQIEATERRLIDRMDALSKHINGGT